MKIWKSMAVGLSVTTNAVDLWINHNVTRHVSCFQRWFHCGFCLKLVSGLRSWPRLFIAPWLHLIQPHAGMRLLMCYIIPFRWMWLLFSDDLTVSDSVPSFVFPSHTRCPQESEFQETSSDRSDGRETEDGGLSGMENNTSFLLFSLHLQLLLAGAVGHTFENGNKVLAREKKPWFLCEKEDICEEGMIGFTQLCLQCVDVSLWKNVGPITCLFMSD